MTVSLTREQKLVFCLAQNAVRFERSLDAFAISRTLVECGVFEENPLPVGEQNKEATMVLLKSLFEMWSSKNDARAQQFRIFRLAVGEAGNSAECLPDLGCTEEELDAHFLQLKDVRTDVARWLTPYTAIVEELVDSCGIRNGKALTLESVTSSECESILRKILSHRCCDISRVWQLLASSSFLTERNRLVTLGETLELPIIDVLNELAMKEGSATQMGVCHEMTTRSSEDFSPTEDSVVPSKGMLTRRVRLRQSADCVGFLQRILSCSKGSIDQLQSLLVSGNSRQKSPAARTQRAAECFRKRKGSVVDAVPDSYQHLLYKFAFQEVHVYWKQMGVSLGFDKTELDGMEKDHHRLGPKDMAWTMLHDYCQWKGQTQASIEYLRSVLRDVKRIDGSCLFPLRTEPINSAAVVGRDREVKDIQAFFWGLEVKNYLVASMTERKIQVIAGLGGVGKTSLAKWYARKHANAYSDGVFTFNAESYGSLLSSFKQNLLAISEEIKVNPLVSENARIFCAYLRRCPRALMIFDNVDEMELVRESIPDDSATCHVLITTRKNDLFSGGKVKTVVLQKLEKKFAIEALVNWAGKDSHSFKEMNAEEREYAEKLAVDPPVEGFPLALAHAGIFIEQHQITFRKYWRRLEARKKKLDAAAFDIVKFLEYFRLSHLKEDLQREGVLSPGDLLKVQISEVSAKSFEQRLMMKAVDSLKNKQLVHLTWEMDLDDIEEKHPKSYLVLQCCSVLSSQDIPQWILSNSAFVEEDEDLREISLAVSMRCLKERSFLLETEKNDGSVYSMHHLIQTSVLERMWGNPGLYENILQTVGQKIADIATVDFANPALISLLPHLYSVAKRMLEFGMNSKQPLDVIDLACRLSACYSNLKESKTLHTLRINNLENTPDSLGIICNKQKQLTECYFKLALEALLFHQFQEVDRLVHLGFGGRSPYELTDEEFTSSMYSPGLSHLADTYVKQGLYDKAQTLLSRMIEVYSSRPSTKDQLFFAYIAMASLHGDQGNYQKQLDMLDFAQSSISQLQLPLCS